MALHPKKEKEIKCVDTFTDEMLIRTALVHWYRKLTQTRSLWNDPHNDWYYENAESHVLIGILVESKNRLSSSLDWGNRWWYLYSLCIPSLFLGRTAKFLFLFKRIQYLKKALFSVKAISKARPLPSMFKFKLKTEIWSSNRWFHIVAVRFR
jgi:hypothetical protein